MWVSQTCYNKIFEGCVFSSAFFFDSVKKASELQLLLQEAFGLRQLCHKYFFLLQFPYQLCYWAFTQVTETTAVTRFFFSQHVFTWCFEKSFIWVSISLCHMSLKVVKQLHFLDSCSCLIFITEIVLHYLFVITRKLEFEMTSFTDAWKVEQIFPTMLRVSIKANLYFKAFRYTVWQKQHMVW